MNRGLATAVALALLSGCSNQSSPPPLIDKPVGAALMTQDPDVQVVGNKPQVIEETGELSQAVRVTLRLQKKALFNREFLYGADLQYSSFFDPGMTLYNQSLAIGHIPARFRRVGKELQLIADQKRLYPGDQNHPEQLLSRYTILEESPFELIVTSAESGVFLAEIFEATRGDAKGGLIVPTGKKPRDSWIRSFDYYPEDNTFVQQTSVILDDGTIAEFAESLFPRELLAPTASFQKFEMNPEDPIGGDEGPVARFRFLAGEKTFQGEDPVAYAQHFDIGQDDPRARGTIDWYATRNIPEEFLAPVKQAVEGWNRYYEKFEGIARPVVRFRGRLPEGIRLGDPRYNVINWDSRKVAGAAYETQASDPATGKQSHSLIYMPAAWLQIGQDYWKYGKYTELPATDRLPQSNRLRVACARDIRSLTALVASGRLDEDELKKFGIELFKQTLFHEVGHALGLAHNFKGSLSFDRSKPGSLFSTSIMDYNDFEIERGAFSGVDSADGPALEYDRQALSALYNQSKDIRAADPVVPTCNDAEADAKADGVDPLCIRYDSENDPTLATETAWKRVTEAALAGDVTLAQSVARVTDLVLKDEALSTVDSAEKLDALAKNAAESWTGAMRFYFLSGKVSLSRAVRTNVKSLLKFQKEVLPEGYSERAMRERAFTAVTRSVALLKLPESAQTAIAQARKAALERLSATPYVRSLGRDAAQAALAKLEKALSKPIEAFAQDETQGLAKLRAAVLGSIARDPAVPFFFGKLDQSQLDYETGVIALLAPVVTDREGRTSSERIAAAKSLVSYKGRSTAEAALRSATEKLEEEKKLAFDNDSRELIETLLTLLGGAASGDDPS